MSHFVTTSTTGALLATAHVLCGLWESRSALPRLQASVTHRPTDMSINMHVPCKQSISESM